MLPGTFTNGAVVRLTSRVTVNGKDRPHAQVDLSAEMRSDLPAQLVQSSGSFASHGTVWWTVDDEVQERPLTGFRDFGMWRPRKGDRVVVYQGDGTQWWPRFTGLIDETTGALDTGMKSTIVADVDRLTAPFECEALLQRMPPVQGSTSWRWNGVSPMFLLDAAMRAGGYNTTPATSGFCALHVPLQTSMLPAVGTSATLLTGGDHTEGGAVQENWPAPWGFASANFRATYQPAYTRLPSEPVAIAMMITEAHAGGGEVAAWYGGAVIRLAVLADRSAVVMASASGGRDEVCAIPAAKMAGAVRVEVLVRNGSAVVRADNGAEARGNVPSLGSSRMSRVGAAAAPEARVAGVQVYHPGQEWQYLDAELSARIITSTGSPATWGVTNASPRFERQSATTAVEHLADTTLSAVWIDEHGVLTIAPSGALRGTASAQTITTVDDVLALAWTDRVLAVASRVTVAYRHPSLSSGSARSVTVAEGARRTLRTGDIAEDTYGPSTDEDWYGVDASPQRLPGAVGWSDYNSAIGSYTGVTYYVGDDPATGTAPGTTDISVARTGLAEWTVTHQAGTYGAGVTAETATYPTTQDTGLWQRNLRNPLPVLRAWGRVEWLERETTQATGAPGPTLTINLGGQAVADTAQRVRDYVAGIIADATPRITALEVKPDPRRQRGDIITLASQNYLGVTLRCLITGIDESMSADGATQHLSLDVLRVDTGALTWAEWEQVFPGTLTFEQWQNRRDPGDTFDDFNTSPLEGA